MSAGSNPNYQGQLRNRKWFMKVRRPGKIVNLAKPEINIISNTPRFKTQFVYKQN